MKKVIEKVDEAIIKISEKIIANDENYNPETINALAALITARAQIPVDYSPKE